MGLAAESDNAQLINRKVSKKATANKTKESKVCII